MTTINLRQRDVETVISAMELAGDKYKENARYLRDTKQPGYERLAQQFDQQALDMDRLIALFQEAGGE